MLEISKERPASKGGRVTGTRLPRSNIMAVFRDLTSARRAIAALGDAAIEAEKISLAGPTAGAASRQGMTDLDIRIARFLANRVAVGATAGALAGAGLGLFVGITALTILDWHVSFGAVFASMLFGAAGLSAMGGFTAGTYDLQAAESQELPFDDSRGPAIVGVHSEKREEIALAVEVLKEQHPVEVYRTDSRGRRLPAPRSPSPSWPSHRP